jgi:hypothetical protein
MSQKLDVIELHGMVTEGEGYFTKVVEVSIEIGVKGIMGRGCLYLGLLHKAKNRISLPKEGITEAVELFEKCHADVYLKQAKDALRTLEELTALFGMLCFK